MKKLLLMLIALPMIGFGQQTYVPDDNFEQTLINQGYDTVTSERTFCLGFPSGRPIIRDAARLHNTYRYSLCTLQEAFPGIHRGNSL